MTTRPMVLIDQLPWHELNRDGELDCIAEDPFLREVEFHLRAAVYKWKHFPVDMVVEPFLTIPYSVRNSGWGIECRENTAVTDEKNAVISHSYINQLETEEDLEKIRDMEITVDRKESAEWLEAVKYLFDGILPVRQAGGTFLRLGIWDALAELMGVENIYFDLMDRSEFIHRILERMMHSLLEGIRQVNELGLVDTAANTCHCSIIYNDEQLPGFGEGQGSDTHMPGISGLRSCFPQSPQR